MPIRKPKPTSPGRRFSTYPDFAEITKTEPEKTLVEGLKKSGGRNAHGRKTSRHRGGGAKRLYRRIDFKRRRDGIPAKVAAIEYDPNRSAYIALLHYADGVKAYILAPARTCTTAFFQARVRPLVSPRRLGLDFTLRVRTSTTRTSKSASTAWRIWVLCASGWTRNVYLSLAAST